MLWCKISVEQGNVIYTENLYPNLVTLTTVKLQEKLIVNMN